MKTLVKVAFGMALTASIVIGASAFADSDSMERPTFTKDVLPILQENCQVCHRPGGANLGGMVAPMAFTTYEETRPWAKAIARQVSTRNMPPWHAAPEFHGVFANERTLSEKDVQTLVRWAETGAVRGNPQDAPPAKEWPSSGWSIGEPDLIVQMPVKFLVADEIQDAYEDFTTVITKDMLPNDRWIKAVEFRPGSEAVHHIIARPFGGIAPGNDPTIHPDGLGVLLRTGTTVTWQMHYHKEPGPGTAVWDQSEVAVKFYPEGTHIPYPIKGDPLGTFRFTIPPGDPNYSVTTEFVFDEDARIVKFMPHMHLRGKSSKFTLTYPDGREEVILWVPRYDFNWQTEYQFKEFKFVPKGTKLTLTNTWDNSANNPYNPDPTATVRWGQPTTDEMSFGWMSYISATPAPAPSETATD